MMNAVDMMHTGDPTDRRTSADVVFDRLHEEIATLKLLPGAKLSETETAKRFGVSRQPVREAFTRLGNLDLLHIRPQRATIVRGFSMGAITHARFVRLAVELEVIRHACRVWDDRRTELLQRNLDRQRQAIKTAQPVVFHALDREFHKLVCELAGFPLAVKTIEECQQKVDRLCMLGLGHDSEAGTLLEDHQKLAFALEKGSIDQATDVAREHLARLDETIAEVRRTHSEYFE